MGKEGRVERGAADLERTGGEAAHPALPSPKNGPFLDFMPHPSLAGPADALLSAPLPGRRAPPACL